MRNKRLPQLNQHVLTQVDDVTDDQLIHTDYITLGRRTKKYDHRRDYLTVCAGFDIETTKVRQNNRELSFMYIWQLSYNELVIIGRTWEQFTTLLTRIITLNDLNEKRRIIIYIANLGYEFSFLCKYFSITELFAKKSRHPITCTINHCIELRDALAITNSNLATLAKMYTVTQKTKDLDYTLTRNSKTKLTPLELQYCINDVRILAEFANYIYNTYIIPKKYIPITASNLLRRKIKDNIRNKKVLSYLIRSQYPTYEEYSLMINYLYRGGVSHSNALYVDIPIEDPNIEIRDFTSSYPAVMLQKYVPVTRFKRVFDDFRNYVNDYCCKILLRLKNITSKTTHSLESKNKIIEYSNDAVYDNGRLNSASEILVYITELDWFNYNRFYNFDIGEVYKCEIANRGYLPEYLTQALADDYKTKHDLKDECKRNGIDPDTVPDYGRTKARINTYYGVTVTKIHTMQDVYDDIKGWECIRNFDYTREVEKAFLLPQWGIWITAHARYNLMQSIADLCDLDIPVLQYDTDSIILIRNKTSDRYFDTYNNNIYKINSAMCDRLHIDYDIFYNIGEYDIKCHPIKIKCMGAKRYIYTKPNGEIITTIAGLPKQALSDLCKEQQKNPYDIFSNKMYLGLEVSQKLSVSYIDEPTTAQVIDYQGNIDTMQELTSCVLRETDFTMTLTPEFLTYYTHLQERKRRGTI